MVESIGLIERAAALLRQQDSSEPASSRKPPAQPDFSPSGRQLVLDRGRLASFGIAIPSSERSRTVEEFRVVKRNLIASWSQNDVIDDPGSSRLIMVTSARPGEGKTFSAINLALSFASERSVKALLVDLDTQHPGLPKIFGFPGDKGIVDVLAGNARLSEVLIETNLTNLMIVPAGRGGPHVPELLSSREMSALLAQLTDQLADRFIIIDTPPCIASSDAAALAPLVGQIVFVVEAYGTQRDEIEAALSMLSACPRISLLLNKTDTQASEHFGSYGYYKYYSAGGGGNELRATDAA
jgi:receptor protein-tyrosine kinase